MKYLYEFLDPYTHPVYETNVSQTTNNNTK